MYGSEKVKPLSTMHNYNRFYSVLLADKIIVWGMRWVFKHKDLQMFALKLNRYE